MKKVFVLFSIISILVLSTGCTPTTEPVAEEPETPEQTTPVVDLKTQFKAQNDVSAAKPPFDFNDFDTFNVSLNFTNGEWELVDIHVPGNMCIFKIISKVTYTNSGYNCTSMVIKVDFDKGSVTEETVDYNDAFDAFKILFETIGFSPDCLTLSHGYLTDNTAVIIIKADVQFFNTIYSNAAWATIDTMKERVLSNSDRTKYMVDIPRSDYQETLFFHKSGTSTTPYSEFADCTNECNASDFVLAGGIWLDVQNEIQQQGAMHSFYSLNVNGDTITKIKHYSIYYLDVQAIAASPGMSEFPDAHDLEKIQAIKAVGNDDAEPAGCFTVLVDGSNLVCACLNKVSDTDEDYTTDKTRFTNNASSIKTNADKTKYIISANFGNSENNTIISKQLYLHKVN